MGKKESNEVRMLGVLPSQGADPIPVGKIPDGGTQVLKQSLANNDTIIIHTVATGKTLYLSAASLSTTFSDEAPATSTFFLRDQNDANAIVIYTVTRTLSNGSAVGQCFFPPIEIPALWDICISSNTTGLYANGFIHGYEV